MEIEFLLIIYVKIGANINYCDSCGNFALKLALRLKDYEENRRRIE